MTSEVFRFLKRRTVHEWGVWSLVTDHFEDQGGESFARTLLTTPGAVAVVATDSESPDCNVVLVHQFRASVRKFCWEIPAGMCDVEGEPPRLTAERELKEEAGLVADSWRELGGVRQASGISNAYGSLFWASGLTPVSDDRHGPEEAAMSVHHVPLRTALSMIESGEMDNSLAVIGILRVARILGI